MVVHSIGDLTFFLLVWPMDAGRRLVSEGGADAGFYANIAILVVGLPLWVLAWRRLLKATRRDPPVGTVSGSLATA
jgi:hypothetical protein